ncbi:MAG: TRAP transporter permease [Synergistaceae bacterium]|jgi:TRAP transporter 4TM/12TM fusion protein|nr:TRAP transporter permease [Synergistaceae bacterium]
MPGAANGERAPEPALHTEKIEEISQAHADAVLEKIDKESAVRKVGGGWAKAIAVIAVLMSVYHLVTSSGWYVLPAMEHRSVHLSFLMALTFLLYPAFGKKKAGAGPSVCDLIWLVFAVASSAYVFFYFEEFSVRQTAITRDHVMGAIVIICVLEATRRSVGKELMLLSMVFLAYGFWGEYIPGILGHTGFSVRRIIYHLYLSSEGIFGTALGVSATYIFLFILFGAFLAETGMGGFIKDFAMCLAGRTIGGEAKVAIVTCGLMGMINGSAVGNVAATGTFTIPLMRSAGFKPVFSAALVAAAGTGGMIMPPVMGAASFIMAEYLGMHYSLIMLAAAIPAVLYYVSQYAYVHVEAIKLGMTKAKAEDITPMRTVMARQGYLVLPVAIIVWLLLIGRTPLFAAFYGIVSTVIVTLAADVWKKAQLASKLLLAPAAVTVALFLLGFTPLASLLYGILTALVMALVLGFRSGLVKAASLSPAMRSYLKAMEQGARQSVSVGVACAVVGIINGVTSLTGLALVLGNSIVAFAHGNVFFTAFLTMIVSIILGMGLPTTACYIITATIAVPALIKIGVNALAAHMFCYYFACLSNLTPPVAIASYGAAGLSGQSPSEVGWAGFRIALPGFVIPFTFIYSPALLFVNATTLEVIQGSVTAFIGVVAASIAMQGYFRKPLNIPTRAMLFAGSAMLIFPGTITDTLGIALVVGFYIYEKFFAAKAAR